MYRSLDQHKDCHVSNLKSTFIFKVPDEFITENSKLRRLLALLDVFLFDILTIEFTKVLEHLCLLHLSSLFWFFLKQTLEAEGSFFTLKTSKFNRDLILSFELGISPVTQLALTYPGSHFCQEACVLCHLLLLLPFVTSLLWSNQALQNTEIKSGDWVQLTGPPTC